MIRAYPGILKRKTKSLNARIHWLKEQGVKNIGKMISTFPRVLSLDIEENLSPKIKLLKKEWDISMKNIETMQPTMLGASLNRIRELTVFFKEIGVNIKDFSTRRRMDIAYAMSVNSILNDLKKDGVIKSDAESSLELLDNELKNIKDIVESGNFSQYLGYSNRPPKPYQKKCKGVITTPLTLTSLPQS